MTGPQGMGVLRPLAALPTIPYVQVAAWSTLGSWFSEIPNTVAWYPGDYLVAQVFNYSGAGTDPITTYNEWLTRLDSAGSNSSAIFGGFMTGVNMMKTNNYQFSGQFFRPHVLAFNGPTSANTIISVGVYRAINPTTPVGTVINPAAIGGPATVGPLNIPNNGGAVYFAQANDGSGTAFIPSNATDRMSDQSGSTYLARLSDVAGPNAAFNFSVPTTSTGNNRAGAIVLNPGNSSYSPVGTPTFISAGTVGTSSTGTDLTLALPSGISVGDLLVAVMHEPADMGAPHWVEKSGWSKTGVRGGSGHAHVFTKFVQAGETNPTFTSTNTGGNKHGRIYAYSGVGGYVIADYSFSNPISPSIATRIINTMVLNVVASTGATSLAINSNPNGYTNRGVAEMVGGGGVGLADKLIASVSTPPTCPTWQTASGTGAGTLESAIAMYLVPSG